MANAIWQATIVDQSGNVLPGAEVTVVDESTGLSAPLFTTRTGTTKSNPFFADANGFAQFYAAPGLYRITATSSGTGTTMTWRNVRLIDVGTSAGDVMEVGAGGWLGRAGNNGMPIGFPATLSESISQIYRNTSADRIVPTYSPSIHFASVDTWGRIRVGNGSSGANKNIVIAEGGTTSFPGSEWQAALWNSGNTTVDGSGFIKSASPIVKLYADKIEANDYKEIEDCTFERVDKGHYIIKGAPLLSRDGWYIETLKDRNNNIYFTLDYEELEDGLHIKTYEPDYSTGRATNGSPVDINEGRFVTLRFEEDPSLYPAPEEPEESVK